MAQKFSKHRTAPERKRSATNHTGGQARLKESNRRNARRITARQHGNVMKKPGSPLTG